MLRFAAVSILLVSCVSEEAPALRAAGEPLRIVPLDGYECQRVTGGKFSELETLIELASVSAARDLAAHSTTASAAYNVAYLDDAADELSVMFARYDLTVTSPAEAFQVAAYLERVVLDLQAASLQATLSAQYNSSIDATDSLGFAMEALEEANARRFDALRCYLEL